MLDARLDLSRSPVKIPEAFYHVRYDHERYPGAPGVRGIAGGANCQQYAFEFLRAFGFAIPDFRSSDLWADTIHSVVSEQPRVFDLVLVNDKPDPWGAHVGVYLASGLILHLSKKFGVPAIEPLEVMIQRPQYRYLIGFKRIVDHTEKNSIVEHAKIWTESSRLNVQFFTNGPHGSSRIYP
jgi:lipoprotein Spr